MQHRPGSRRTSLRHGRGGRFRGLRHAATGRSGEGQRGGTEDGEYDSKCYGRVCRSQGPLDGISTASAHVRSKQPAQISTAHCGVVQPFGHTDGLLGEVRLPIGAAPIDVARPNESGVDVLDSESSSDHDDLLVSELNSVILRHSVLQFCQLGDAGGVTAETLRGLLESPLPAGPCRASPRHPLVRRSVHGAGRRGHSDGHTPRPCA